MLESLREKKNSNYNMVFSQRVEFLFSTLANLVIALLYYKIMPLKFLNHKNMTLNRNAMIKLLFKNHKT